MRSCMHKSSGVEYHKTDLGWTVTVYGKRIGVIVHGNTVAGAIGYSGPFVFLPMSEPMTHYHGFSMDDAVLAYLADQYGGGLDG